MGKLNLGSCYHTGLAYALAYDANGETELCGKLFTNLESGIDGCAIAALETHRRQFNPDRDIKLFIVALKPVKIITGLEKNEDYKLETNAGCDNCGIEDRVYGDKLCANCAENDICDECDEECCSSCCEHSNIDCDDINCQCYEEDDTCSECDGPIDDCFCDDGYQDEFFAEMIIGTFKTMNAFARARWIKAQIK